MPAVNDVGELGAGEPHAQFDGGRLETERRPLVATKCVRGKRRARAPGPTVDQRHRASRLPYSRTFARGRRVGGSSSNASPSRSGCGRNCGRSTTSSRHADINPSPSKAAGWLPWCEGTRPTTPCPGTAMRSPRSAPRWRDTGTRRYGAPQPARPDDLGTDEPHPDSMATPPPRDVSLPGGPLRRHSPKVGAQCGSPARWDLCGGPPARAVPTATPFAAAGGEVADGDVQAGVGGEAGEFDFPGADAVPHPPRLPRRMELHDHPTRHAVTQPTLFLREPLVPLPGRRDRTTAAESRPRASVRPRRTVSGATPAACATTATPPAPSSAATAPNHDRRCSSLRCGRSTSNRRASDSARSAIAQTVAA